MNFDKHIQTNKGVITTSNADVINTVSVVKLISQAIFWWYDPCKMQRKFDLAPN